MIRLRSFSGGVVLTLWQDYRTATGEDFDRDFPAALGELAAAVLIWRIDNGLHRSGEREEVRS